MDKRMAALRRFAMSITALTVVGHLFLGFETSWAQVVATWLTAWTLELVLETVEARSQGRAPRYRGGGVRGFVEFLLPAHIAATSLGFLLFPGDRLLPLMLAAAIAIGTKYLVRAPVNGRMRHVLNPSNVAIAVVLTFYPFVGVAPSYEFTETTSGALDWLIPAFLLAFGTMLNVKLTGRSPLILAWVLGFAAQAVLRAVLLPDENTLLGGLGMMVGATFVLFTNYMITDPGTTPSRPRNQVWFGLSAAAVYGLLVSFHVVYGLFYAVVVVCVVRAAALWVIELHRRRAAAPTPLPVPAVALEAVR
jgi:enediyne biosynthesis protein E5